MEISFWISRDEGSAKRSMGTILDALSMLDKHSSSALSAKEFVVMQDIDGGNIFAKGPIPIEKFRKTLEEMIFSWNEEYETERVHIMDNCSGSGGYIFSFTHRDEDEPYEKTYFVPLEVTSKP